MKNPDINRVLVTGSSGTIGTRLCERLLEEGYDVAGVDWRPNKWNEDIQEKTTVMDLRDPANFEQLATDFDLVIHLAANARVYNLVIDPTMARDNFETTFNTLEFARKNNIGKFIFSSSREVYGNSEKVEHCEEEGYIKNCESAYTASKIGGEALVHAYNQCYGMGFCIVRYSNVYGMYDDSDRVIPVWIKLARDGESLTVFGEDKILDFTYIDDTVNGTLLAIEKFDKADGNVFNIASGRGTSMTEVALLIQKFTKNYNDLIIKDNRTGEVVKYTAIIDKARDILGYEPQFSIEEGVKKSIEWYAREPATAKEQ